MSIIPPEEGTPQKKNRSSIQFVEELANSSDAWISITDAARITRTSEAMARRWVTSGRLPVKRQAVGINQHTRLVRLSDVAAIRPIIDPTAAISDEVHTLDLPSIPRQQAQLMRDHASLLQRVVAAQNALEELAVQLREQKNTLEQSRQDSREHEQKLYREMGILGTTLGEQLETLQITMQRMLQEGMDTLTQQNHDWQVHIERLQHDLTLAQKRHDKQMQTAFQEMADTIRQHHWEHQHELTEKQQTLTEKQEALTQLVETQIQAIKDSLKQDEREQEQTHAIQAERLEKIEQWLEQVIAQGKDMHALVLEYQKRVHILERQLKTLTKTTHDEIKERKKLSEHLRVQQRQIQFLRREFDNFKR